MNKVLIPIMLLMVGCASEPLTFEQRERLLYVAQGLQDMGNSLPRRVYVQSDDPLIQTVHVWPQPVVMPEYHPTPLIPVSR